MRDPVTFQSVAIESFRGFRERHVLDMAASAVVLAGPNGTGKTSVFDAIQWLLLGRITRLEPLRARQNDEHIVNQYALPGPAVVEAAMEVGHQTLTIQRTGDYRNSLLELKTNGEVLRGDEAQEALEELLRPADDVSLETALLTSGILQQDVMRTVLEAKPRERFEHLTALLGLEVLEEFESAVDAFVKLAKKATLEARLSVEAADLEAQKTFESIRQIESRAAARPSMDVLTAAVADAAALLSDRVAVGATDLSTADDVLLAAADAAKLGSEISHLASVAEDLRDSKSEAEPVSDEEIVSGTSSATQAEEVLSAAEEALARVTASESALRRQTERFSELAALAIPLLTEVCPVCDQSIVRDEVARRLSETTEDVAQLMALESEVTRAHEAVDSAHEGLRGARAAVTQLEERKRTAQRIERNEAELAEEFRRISTDTRFAIDESLTTAIPEPSTLRELESGFRQLEGAYQRLSGALGSSDPEELARLGAELEALNVTAEGRRLRVEELSQRESRASTLLTATTSARVDVTSGRFSALEPLVEDIFSRLDPHPSFKNLVFEHEIYRSKGTTSAKVRDPVAGLAADPLLIFSAAQANIAALAYFLALGWAAGERALPFVLLDDPLQSMDDVNVLGFADLCRMIRKDRQLVIATHEDRFASLLERKFAPRSDQADTIVHEFQAWERNGPVVRTRHVPSQVSEASNVVLRAV